MRNEVFIVNPRNKIKGMTLLEIMLVLAIAASMILMGIQLYQSSETEKNYFVLKTNVDLLFQAMKGYYQTECDLYFSENGSVGSKGALTFNPANAPIPPAFASISFDVTTVNRYIASTWPRYTSVVYDNSSEAASYFAQFNPLTGTNKKTYACWYFGSGSPVCDPASTLSSSNIVLWQAQIAVKMKDPAKTTYYVGIAGADCAVDTIPSDAPVNCATGGVTMGVSANYMVWQRLPSFSSPNIRSPNWISNPVVKEFKLQYTHDPMYELYNPSATLPDMYQYYYCGG